MFRIARLEPALRALTAILLVVAAVALLREPTVPAVEIPIGNLDTVPAAGSTHAPLDAAAGPTIVEANIFSASRTAPVERYRPFDPEPASAPTMLYDPEMDSVAIAEDDAVPRLYGTIVGPAGGIALMRLDADVPEARLYREGDRAGPWRVVKINEQSVVLDGPQGRIELRLLRREESGP